MYTYFQVSDFVKKKASFKIQEVILQLYNPTKAAFQTCNHSWSIKAPSSRQYSTSVSLNRLFNATIAWNKVKFTCNKYTIHLHWESNVHSIYKTLIKRVPVHLLDNSLYAYLLIRRCLFNVLTVHLIKETCLGAYNNQSTVLEKKLEF